MTDEQPIRPESSETSALDDTLSESLRLISIAMLLDDNGEYEQALLTYIQGSQLLITVADTNDKQKSTEFIQMISNNLKHISIRIESLQERIKLRNMMNNLQNTMDANMNELEMNLHSHLTSRSMDISNSLFNEEQKVLENDENMVEYESETDDFLANLFQKFYGLENENENENKNENEIECNADGNDQQSNTNIIIRKRSTLSSINIPYIINWQMNNGLPNNYQTKYSNINLFGSITTDICCYIYRFLSARDISKLLSVSKWVAFQLLHNIQYQYLWKRLVIGADPIRNALGHNLRFRWLKTKNCGKILRNIVEHLIFSQAGLALDTNIFHSEVGIKLENETTDDSTNISDLYILRKCKFPKLKTLVFYGTRILLQRLSLRVLFKNLKSQLKQLFIEVDYSLDIYDIVKLLPNLNVLAANIIDCQTLMEMEMDEFEINVFEKLYYLSFVFGVNDYILQCIFHCFPNLKHLSLEFDEICESFSNLLMMKSSVFDVFHMSWNMDSFWGTDKSVGQMHIQMWMKDVTNIRKLILDRDYVFTNDHPQSGLPYITADVVTTLKELLPDIEDICICSGSCINNLLMFARFCDLM